MTVIKDEIGIMTKTNHENVVKYIESYEDDRFLWIVMEALIPSLKLQDVYTAKLKEWDRRSPLFDESTVRWIMKSILAGLNHIHEMGVTHRDLNLENILLVDDDIKTLKIIDFGISINSREAHETAKTIGNIGYLAPEIFCSEGNLDAYAPPVDVWAAGLICC